MVRTLDGCCSEGGGYCSSEPQWQLCDLFRCIYTPSKTTQNLGENAPSILKGAKFIQLSITGLKSGLDFMSFRLCDMRLDKWFCVVRHIYAFIVNRNLIIIKVLANVLHFVQITAKCKNVTATLQIQLASQCQSPLFSSPKEASIAAPFIFMAFSN